MRLEILSWAGGRCALVRPTSTGHDAALTNAYGRYLLFDEPRDVWLDFFDVSKAVRRAARKATARSFTGCTWVGFETPAEDYERALADETQRPYQGVLKKG